ncbi:alpha-galactosidase [Porphyromonas macacae]|uniref:glycoside hydrolase family 27 protein n=1 Tax=Porphyromonas macacae TaxID=28115 RepID=UPI00052B746B|nr:glycoside hydrolase family 27 protein [Porphyromonas macacae]KGO00098.1 alpha-galactosidase [Porphyromonas macacae]
MKIIGKAFLIFATLFNCPFLNAQNTEVKTPPMGYMTWNYYGLNIHENDIKMIADIMVESGLKDLGYNYIFIDDGWQGGRDNKNNIIPDPQKFPSGMKSLVDYVHGKGLKIGIYSDAAPLTCGGYTGSLHFEEQDAKTFAEWGFDYLKYDYCGAPDNRETAIERYTKMSNALKKTGRNITLGICEWGDRSPWLWAEKAGGTLWRTTADIRDKWESIEKAENAKDLHRTGAGILDILNINADLDEYAKIGAWNDPDMLVVGLHGKPGAPSTDLGGVGCTDVEYRSQMSLWCLMAAPLMITCDLQNMSKETVNILMNRDIIAINQDVAGKQAKRIIKTSDWQVFLKELSDGDYALGVLNTGEKENTIDINLKEIGISGKIKAKDLWSKKTFGIRKKISVKAAPHETKVYRLSQQKR